MDDELLACSECGWSGPEDDAMPAEEDGQDTLYFCPECTCIVFSLS